MSTPTTAPNVDELRDETRFVCFFWFNSWDHVSLGFHICFSQPNIEIHLPFGFVKIGWDRHVSHRLSEIKSRGFGIGHD